MNHRVQVDAICVSADVLNTTLPLRRVLSVRLQVIEFDVARTFGGLLGKWRHWPRESQTPWTCAQCRTIISTNAGSFARGWLLWLLPCFSNFGRLVNLPMLFLRTSYGACANGVANSNDFVPATCDSFRRFASISLAMRTDFSGIRSMLSSALCDGRCVATAAWSTLSRKSASGVCKGHRGRDNSASC